MTTVTAVKRAVEEAYKELPSDGLDKRGLYYLSKSPTALTILANRLSDRGEAGNTAVSRNLQELADLRDLLKSGAMKDALEWAIDQLTPPELASASPLASIPYLMAEEEAVRVASRGKHIVAKNPVGAGWVVVKDQLIKAGPFYIESDADKRAAKLNEEAAK